MHLTSKIFQQNKANNIMLSFYFTIMFVEYVIIWGEI